MWTVQCRSCPNGLAAATARFGNITSGVAATTAATVESEVAKDATQLAQQAAATATARIAAAGNGFATTAWCSFATAAGSGFATAAGSGFATTAGSGFATTAGSSDFATTAGCFVAARDSTTAATEATQHSAKQTACISDVRARKADRKGQSESHSKRSSLHSEELLQAGNKKSSSRKNNRLNGACRLLFHRAASGASVTRREGDQQRQIHLLHWSVSSTHNSEFNQTDSFHMKLPRFCGTDADFGDYAGNGGDWRFLAHIVGMLSDTGGNRLYWQDRMVRWTADCLFRRFCTG